MEEEPTEKLCGKHDNPLQIFCKECQVLICVVCLSVHKRHEVIPVTEAILYFQKELSVKHQEIQKKDQQLLNIFYKKQEQDGKTYKRGRKSVGNGFTDGLERRKSDSRRRNKISNRDIPV